MSNVNALAQQVNVTAKFTADLHNLLEVMGKSDVTIMPAGSAVSIYKEGTEASISAAAKGGLIPDSKVTPVLNKTVTLGWTKKRSIAAYEDIQVQGYDIAVGGTADKLVKMCGAVVRTALCDAIKSGTTTKASDGSTALAGSTVQAAAAKAVARLIEVTADEAGTPIFFMSPMTFASYAGSAAITTQEAYGMQYLKGFLGIGNAIVLPGLADSKVYCTTEENINLCAASIGSIANVMTDASGVLGISIEEAPEYAGIQVCVYDGVQAFLNILDRCVIASVA